MTITSEVRSSEVIRCANCSGPLSSVSTSDSLESPVLAFDSFVQNRHVRVTLRNALGQVFGVTDLEECHFCVHCCLIFSQLYGLFHLLGARRRDDALLASKLKESGGTEQNFENPFDQVEVEVLNADGIVSFRNASDSIEFHPVFNNSEPEGAEQDDSRPASPISDHEQSVAPDQREDPPFDEIIDPDAVSSAILAHVTQNGQRILYRCCDCQEGFPNIQNFINHRLSSHASVSALDLFKCIVCSEVCKEGTEFRKHLFSHCTSAKRKLYPICDVCGRRFVTKRLVHEHHKAVHFGKEKPKNRRRCEPWDYKCSDCGEVFTGVKNLYDHRRVLHSKRRRKQKQHKEGTHGASEVIEQLEKPERSKQTDEEINAAAEVSAGPGDDAAIISSGSAGPSTADREADHDANDGAAAYDFYSGNDGTIDAADDNACNVQAAADSASEFSPPSSSESDESEDSASSSSEEDGETPRRKKSRLDKSFTAPRKPPSKPKGKVGRPLKDNAARGHGLESAKNKTKRPKPKPIFHCNDCNVPLASAAEVGRHKREKHGIAFNSYQCHQCPAAFNYTASLEGHMVRMHMTDRPFPCHKCSASFPLLDTLKTHMMTKHMELLITRFGTRRDKHFSDIYKRIYLCADCDDRFEGQDSYAEHAKSVHGRIHQCPHCLNLYTNAPQLKEHMLKHERSHECDFCDKIFSDASTLKRHMSSSHADGPGGEKELPEEAIKDSYEPERDLMTDRFHCCDCTERFCQPKEIVDHITTNHPERLKCWCPLCEVKALNKTQLTEHLKVAHKLTPCSYCTVLSKSLRKHMINYHRAELEQGKITRKIRTRVPYHQRRKESTRQRLEERNQRLTAAGEIVYKCVDCDMTFALSKAYRDHRTKAHPGEPVHKCHLCLHTMNNEPRRFQAHLETHNESDDWPCGQPACSRRFLNRRRRDEHLREAHGIKKHTDDYYPLPYSQSMKLITGEMKRTTRAEVPTNYNCVDCGAEFTVITDLGKHRRELHKVHEGKEWVCHVCKKVMRSSDSLRNHMSRHKDSKDVMCDECGKCFGTKQDLQQHRKLNHDPVWRQRLKETWKKSRERRKLAKNGEGSSHQQHSSKPKQTRLSGSEVLESESSSMQHDGDDGGTEESVTFVLFDDDGVE